jgi:hypothetical protein
MTHRVIDFKKTKIGAFAEIELDGKFFFRFRDGYAGKQITIPKSSTCSTLKEFMDWCMEKEDGQ